MLFSYTYYIVAAGAVAQSPYELQGVCRIQTGNKYLPLGFNTSSKVIR